MYLATSIVTLRGGRGIYSTGLALVARLGPVVAASVCVAGVALGDIGPSFCEAGVAIGDIDRHFPWQAWHLRHWAGSGGALGSRGRRLCLRGRRGTWRHPPSFCEAGVALDVLGNIDRRFAWQALHFRHWSALWKRTSVPLLPPLFAWQAWHLATSDLHSVRQACT